MYEIFNRMTTLHTDQVFNLTVDNAPVRLEIIGLTTQDATFTVTGPGVRNPEKTRTMPVQALATWLELQQC